MNRKFSLIFRVFIFHGHGPVIKSKENLEVSSTKIVEKSNKMIDSEKNIFLGNRKHHEMYEISRNFSESVSGLRKKITKTYPIFTDSMFPFRLPRVNHPEYPSNPPPPMDFERL